LPPAEEDPELCKDPKIDAMFNTKDGEIIAFKGTYVHFRVIFPFGFYHRCDTRGKNIQITPMEFPGKYYWKLTDNGVASGYPRRISSTWKELPSNIDAAFTYRNGKTYFFKVTFFDDHPAK